MEVPIITPRSGPTRSSRAEREKESRGKASSMYKNTRYKEKYQAMRERFERANAARKALLQDLELADEKLRKIQEENDLLLDAMLANLLPSQVPNPGYHPSPLPSHPTIPSQSQHSPTELPSHQPSSSALPPLFSSSHSFSPRLDRQDTNIPISLHNYSNHPTPNHFYLSSSSYDGRDGTSHHYSGSSSRSRGLQSDVGQRG
ncbi:hypothetical protein Ac2012v2_002983 [Leucoagaricus gongylophorus]